MLTQILGERQIFSTNIIKIDNSFSFGGPANVARTVRQYARAGIAGLHIEDQVQTKRCGHLMGKQVVSREEFLTRIRAAVLARDSIPGGSDFVSSSVRVKMSRLTWDNRSLLAERIPPKCWEWKRPLHV